MSFPPRGLRDPEKDDLTDTGDLYREIIDESDVYIDVHKAIRRMAPAPKARYQRRLSHGHPGTDGNDSKSSEDTKVGEEDSADNYETRKRRSETGEAPDRSSSGSPMPGTFLLRRASAGLDGRMENVPVRASYNDIRQHLKHLGPSNPASNPKATKSTTVKIKPGVVVHDAPRSSPPVAEQVIREEPRVENDDEDNDETTSLLRPALTPKDGAQALAQKYGATGQSPLSRSVENNSAAKADSDDTATKGVQTTETAPQHSYAAVTAQPPQPQQELHSKSSGSGSELAPADQTSPYSHRSNLFARSGSITENIVESRGIRKVVLETTSSNEDEEEQAGSERNAKSASRSNLNLESHASPSTEGDENASGANSPAVTDAAQAESSNTTAQASGNGNGNGGGGGNKKKNNRRKKRKGGK